MLRTSLVASFAMLLLASCAAPLEPPGSPSAPERHLASIDMIDLVVDDPDLVGIGGITIDEATNTFLTANGQVNAFSMEGEPIAAPNVPPLPVSESGAPRSPYEIMQLDEGRFVLLSDDAGFLWDRVSERVTEYFCVVPNDLGEGPELTQRNGALAVQGLDGLIAAAPRWYDPDGALTGGPRVRQQLALYRAWDGAPLRTIDVSNIEEDIEGLAFTDDGEELFALAGSALLRLDLNGVERERFILDGVDEPRGLVRDGTRIFVADGYAGLRLYDRVVVFDLATADDLEATSAR